MAALYRQLRTKFAAARSLNESDYSMDWMTRAVGHHIHDSYELYAKAAS
jgi:hypothetical protein